MNRLAPVLVLLVIALVAIAIFIAVNESLPGAELVAELEAKGRGIRCPGFSRDGQTLAAYVFDEVLIWDVKTKQVRRTLPHGARISDMVHASKEDWLITATGSKVRIWDTKTGKVRKDFKGHEDWVDRLALAPGNRVLASSEWNGLIKVWDVAAEKELVTVHHQESRHGRDRPLR